MSGMKPAALILVVLVSSIEGFPDISNFDTSLEGTTQSSLIEDTVTLDDPASEKRQYALFGKPRDVFPVINETLQDAEVPFITKIINNGGGSSSNAIKVMTGTKQCRCGYKTTQTIVGGSAADIVNYSWMAAIIDADNNKLFCGGSLITDRHILTASHCVQAYRRTPEDLYVQLRQPNITPETLARPSPASIKAHVKQIIMHERYNSFTIDNDVAILVLKKPLLLREQSLVPVCLPTSNINDFTGQKATIVGWGTESEKHQEPVATLQHVKVPIMSNYDCVTKTDTHHYAGKVNDNMLCAGYLEGQQDACQGDSGGPLTVTKNDVQVQVGVVSWGIGCARPRSPGVYARVGRYVDWIRSKIEGGAMCNNYGFSDL